MHLNWELARSQVPLILFRRRFQNRLRKGSCGCLAFASGSLLPLFLLAAIKLLLPRISLCLWSPQKVHLDHSNSQIQQTTACTLFIFVVLPPGHVHLISRHQSKPSLIVLVTASSTCFLISPPPLPCFLPSWFAASPDNQCMECSLPSSSLVKVSIEVEHRHRSLII